DDSTFVVTYKSAYYLCGLLGVREFWALPQHLLGEPYARYQASGNPDEVTNLPYWTSQFVHLGPFRLTSFDPNEGTTYEAYDGYFLGRPKVDEVRIKTFPDAQTLYASILAGAVDIFADTALSTDVGFQLKDQWDASGGGTVFPR